MWSVGFDKLNQDSIRFWAFSDLFELEYLCLRFVVTWRHLTEFFRRKHVTRLDQMLEFATCQRLYFSDWPFCKQGPKPSFLDLGFLTIFWSCRFLTRTCQSTLMVTSDKSKNSEQSEQKKEVTNCKSMQLPSTTASSSHQQPPTSSSQAVVTSSTSSPSSTSGKRS